MSSRFPRAVLLARGPGERELSRRGAADRELAPGCSSGCVAGSTCGPTGARGRLQPCQCSAAGHITSPRSPDRGLARRAARRAAERGFGGKGKLSRLAGRPTQRPGSRAGAARWWQQAAAPAWRRPAAARCTTRRWRRRSQQHRRRQPPSRWLAARQPAPAPLPGRLGPWRKARGVRGLVLFQLGRPRLTGQGTGRSSRRRAACATPTRTATIGASIAALPAKVIGRSCKKQPSKTNEPRAGASGCVGGEGGGGRLRSNTKRGALWFGGRGGKAGVGCCSVRWKC